jgi:tetratricopeptide (TPR) repeat protein
MLSIKKWWGEGVWAILATLALLAGCAPPGPQALLDGKRLLDQGKYPQAIERLEAATALLATNAQANAAAWNYLGLACQYDGKPVDADKKYRQALKLNPNLAEAHYNLGCLWLAQQNLEVAKGEFTAYTLSRESAVDGFLMLGNVQLRIQLRTIKSSPAQMRARDLDAAESSFNQALRLSTNNPEALNGLGLVRVQRGRAGDFNEAEQYFKAALRQRPGYAPALLNLAVLSQQYLRNRSLALEEYREYLALRPVPEDAEAVRAIVHQLEQELNPPPRPVPPGATRTATNAVVPPSPTPAQSATNATRGTPTPRPERGGAPKAASGGYVYRHPSKPLPGNQVEAQVAFNRGQADWQANRLADAVRDYQTAIQLDPASYAAYFNLGKAATAMGDLPTALGAYENALAVTPESADARYNFALALQQANYFIDAANELDKLLKAYPQEIRVHLALANLCAQQLHMSAMARQHYQKVLDLDPRNPQAEAIRGWLSANP